MVVAHSHLKLVPTSILDICKVFEHIHMLSIGIALHSYTHPRWPRFWAIWVSCGVKIMSLHHGWGWQPPKTASHIHIRHIQISWTHAYAVHGHTLAAIFTYTHPAWAGIWTSRGNLWSQNHVITSWFWGWQTPQTASHIILEICKEFEHIHMLSIGTQ